MRIDIIANPMGLYALTPDGQLGVYDEQKRFHRDAELTATFQQHNARLLKWCAGADGSDARVGIICPTRKSRAWATATMFLDEPVIRRLYPANVVGAPLTVFQKRNQEKSLYRGLELLLECHSKEDTIPMFCPVLFDRGKMLKDYLHILGRPEQDGDADTPVIEVLNLIAGLSLSTSDTYVLHLIQKLHTSVVHKDKRRQSELTLLEANMTGEWDAPTSGYDADARAERELSLSVDNFKKLHVQQNFPRVERWLEIPYRPVTPGDLRRFLHFRELDGRSLDQLAKDTLVYTAPAGVPLLERGMTDQWNLYLLEGTLMLTAHDGQTSTVVGGAPQATAPVAFLKPRKYKVTSLTKVSFLWVHDLLLRVVRSTAGTAPRTAVR